KNTRLPLASGKEYVILERGGIKIGIIGLVEEDWLATLSQVPNVDYEDFIKRGRQLAKCLKSGELGGGVDFVIALTHMRVPNDKLLADTVSEIDLILGGHDHDCFVYGNHLIQLDDTWKGDIRVLKSGCDFKYLGLIELEISYNNDGVPCINSKTARHQLITSDLPEDPEILDEVEKNIAIFKAQTLKVIGITSTQLDARSTNCRLQESNIGNFAADLIRFAYNADIALIGGGTIRSDNVYGPGEITVKDILEIFPFDDPCVVLRIKGIYILQALENGVSEVPKMEG
ncbi:hypothetical protein HK096_010402, partial [Nowakowskiella sp. JEL0078]